MKKLLLILCFALFSFHAFSQLPEQVRIENRVYVPGIKSIKLCVNGIDYGQPIISLNSDEQLRISFDDIEGESRYLKYTVIHCTHNWKISELNPLEYIDGFMEDEISDISYSFSTIQHYAHYELVFPNEQIRIIKSGNYLLYVYDDSQDNPVLTRRFMVVEPTQVAIQGNVRAASDVSYSNTKQQVDFVVRTAPYIVNNPSMFLKATIMQNGRWDNAIVGLRHHSGRPGELRFEYYNNENVMNGGAEFRTFDIRSLRRNGDRIVSVNFRNRINQAYILEDVARPFGAYQSNTTLRGQCLYRNEDYSGRNAEDYVLTHFSLRPDFNITGGDVYVFGELTDWQIQKDAKLKFNPQSNYWEAQMFLKQGYYNYQYVYVKQGTRIIDETYIEGSHWQTQNDYTILIYLQEEGTSYDKLVGISHINITQ